MASGGSIIIWWHIFLLHAEPIAFSLMKETTHWVLSITLQRKQELSLDLWWHCRHLSSHKPGILQEKQKAKDNLGLKERVKSAPRIQYKKSRSSDVCLLHRSVIKTAGRHLFDVLIDCWGWRTGSRNVFSWCHCRYQRRYSSKIGKQHLRMLMVMETINNEYEIDLIFLFLI